MTQKPMSGQESAAGQNPIAGQKPTAEHKPASESNPATVKTPTTGSKSPLSRKQTLYGIITMMVLGAVALGSWFWYQGAYYVKTEDARLAGDVYRAMPRVTGKILSLPVDEGERVVADQVLGQQDTTNLSTGTLDHALLRAPVAGVVIKKLAREGEVVSTGQPVAMIVDDQKLYVSANIEETEISRLQIGQWAEFTIDSFPGVHFSGRIKEIGKATNSTFVLLPPVNTSGNFTKVTQRLPIKLSIDDHQGLPLAPGMNVVLKIHVKGSR
ncbi:HlyD family secretion protein [Heliophilum fasciatum]|uniref:HlyD family secretion protein n=1 Tax=Heliophilum fasciatum TaxID=35700 RepID=A0A4V2SXQ7_9FIRM|nr:efflux RND transporter periplasmic adaptor subunit [Heliophilum fasciatum]MCW2277299.1 multidrug resistance efflux pump [Heliophilum fasciatum]TCP67136.1 HlyD family secretion protein [Heliophilum fasciatum]